MKGCGSTLGNNAFQVGGDDVTVENVVGKDCSKGISISGSGTWVGNSTFSNNHMSGVEIWVGDSLQQPLLFTTIMCGGMATTEFEFSKTML